VRRETVVDACDEVNGKAWGRKVEKALALRELENTDAVPAVHDTRGRRNIMALVCDGRISL